MAGHHYTRLDLMVDVKSALSQDEVLSAIEIAEQTNLNVQTVRRLLDSLEVLGIAERVEYPRTQWVSNRNHCVFGYKLHKIDTQT